MSYLFRCDIAITVYTILTFISISFRSILFIIYFYHQFLDISANTFSRALYLALAEGKTVQEAFDIGKKMVVHCPGVIRNQMSISSEDEGRSIK